MINEKITKNLSTVSKLLNDTKNNFNELLDEYKFSLEVYEKIVNEYFEIEYLTEQDKISAFNQIEYFMGYKAGLQKAVELVFGKEERENKNI